MAQPHELDHISHFFDTADAVNKDRGWGNAAARMLASERGSDYSLDSLLCLGAGQAYPELELVESIGIPHQNVVLLDKLFSAKAKDRLTRLAPDVRLIETGMFSYLQNPGLDRFSLVTTFGLDGIITEETFNEFFRLLPNTLVDSALVFIEFTSNLNIEKAAKTASGYGFTPLDPDNYLFRFQSPHPEE